MRCCWVVERQRENPVVMRPGGTPVPVPNTKVKTWTAEDTALETARESRRPPDYKKREKKKERPGRARGA